MSTEEGRRHFDCGRIRELISDYIDKSLQDEICRDLEEHLKDCPDCRVFVNTMERTIILYKYQKGTDVPEEVRVDLRRYLRTQIGISPSPDGED